MAENLPRSERPHKQSASKTTVKSSDTPSKSVATAPSPALKLTREQKYLAPVGRHSQQTQRRARERASAEGHATEKEQLAHERGVVEANFIQRTQLQQKKREQKSSAKVQTPPAAPATKQKAPVTQPE